MAMLMFARLSCGGFGICYGLVCIFKSVLCK